MYATASRQTENKISTVQRSQALEGTQVTLQRKTNGRDSEALAQALAKGSPTNPSSLPSEVNVNSPSNHLSHLVQTSSIQPKLKIGKPNDGFEQEADQMADKVMTFPSTGIQTSTTLRTAEPFQLNHQIQPQVEEEEEEAAQPKSLFQRQPEEEKEPVQAKSLIQRQPEEEEEEAVQEKLQTSLIQRQAEEEEEQPVQTQAAIFRKEKERVGIRYIVNANEPKQEAKVELQTKPNAFKRFFRKISSFLSRSNGSSGNAESSTSNFDSSLRSSKGSGSPMSDGSRAFMESQFEADFSGVRLHTDSPAVKMSDQINAQAFTHGNDIYFNEGRYNPDTPEGKYLLAHELTHTIQQGASVQKDSAQKTIQNKSANVSSHPKVQRSWLGDAWDSVSGAVSGAVDFVADSLDAGLDWIKDQFSDFVREIPGYTLLTVVLGQDPISGSPVARSGRNFIEAGLDIIPFGDMFKRKLEETGALEEAAAWLDNQMAGLDISLSSILSDLNDFWNGLSLTDIGSPARVLSRAARNSG